MNRKSRLLLAFLVIFLVVGTVAFAQTGEGTEAAATGGRSALATGLIAIAAALAIGITAVGTGIAQSRIGAAGAGTIAERPESTGTIIILIAIPETMVILGFIVAVIMLFTL